MKKSTDFDFEDLQGLLRCGHGSLKETCFLILNIVDASAAKQWLKSAPITNASTVKHESALQIAFSVNGLQTLGLNQQMIESFSDEFIIGMSGDESRSRRLGDMGINKPENWNWGGTHEQVPDVILLIYAKENHLQNFKNSIEDDVFSDAFQLITELPTLHTGVNEPFGFRDGISQPKIDWSNQQSTDLHHRDSYSNLLAIGEVVLGYPNEYGLYTSRPLINPEEDTLASKLLNAIDQPHLKDFGRNGSYLVLRQLDQDVIGFWNYVDKQAEQDKNKREQLAAAMVGRKRDTEGTPLISNLDQNIPGIKNKDNNFDYDKDPKGIECPIGTHVRRSNPRTGDLPPHSKCVFSRIKKILGFGLKPEDDLITSTRYHRILRRGRSYGPVLSPEDAIKPNAKVADRGIQFICLAGNISRQFEFVQNAWSMSSHFGGVQQEQDPLIGNRQPLKLGDSTDQFHQTNLKEAKQKTYGLPQFVTVRGGGYFFMPSLKALNYLAFLPNNRSDDS